MKKKTDRLDKLLAHMGVGSRKDIRKMAKQGRLQVNGEVVKDPGFHVDPDRDEMMADGQKIVYEPHIYLMMNKPKGVISATTDQRERTVIDLLDMKERLFNPFPVGRLDKDTEGLLLLTNDGKLAHELLSPRKHVAKTYVADVDGSVDARMIAHFRQGIVLDDGYVTLPAELTMLPSGDGSSCVQVIIHEGKYHQIKRMFAAVGRQVLALQRVAMGPLILDEALAPGEYRPLSADEKQALLCVGGTGVL